MKMTRLSETRILKILNDYEADRETKNLRREKGISRAPSKTGKRSIEGWMPPSLTGLRN